MVQLMKHGSRCETHRVIPDATERRAGSARSLARSLSRTGHLPLVWAGANWPSWFPCVKCEFAARWSSADMRDNPISRRRFLGAMASAGVGLSLGRAQLRLGASAVRSVPIGPVVVPEILFHADPSVSTVYLTVDDWFDREMVELALDVAERQRIPLTFFPIGRLIAPNADLVLRAARSGHELENHTWDHQRLDLGHCPIAQIPVEIERQFAALQAVLGPSYQQFFLRPPGGFGILGRVNPHLITAATDAGLRIAMWSVDSNGWREGYRSDPAAIDLVLANVSAGLAPGAIVLQHTIPDDMLALETEILIARERGLRMATMADGILGVPPTPEMVAVPTPPVPSA